jgi:hypothetical protein
VSTVTPSKRIPSSRYAAKHRFLASEPAIRERQGQHARTKHVAGDPAAVSRAAFGIFKPSDPFLNVLAGSNLVGITRGSTDHNAEWPLMPTSSIAARPIFVAAGRSQQRVGSPATAIQSDRRRLLRMRSSR